MKMWHKNLIGRSLSKLRLYLEYTFLALLFDLIDNIFAPKNIGLSDITTNVSLIPNTRYNLFSTLFW